MKKDEIIEKLNKENYYNREILSMKFSSSMWGQGLCPFHEDGRPSFCVNRETGNFHCKGCNKRGSIFDFHMKKYNVDFKTALNDLAKEAGLTTTESQKKIIKIYDYTNESGKLLFQTVRYEPKDFKQRRPDGKGEWIYNLQDGPVSFLQSSRRNKV